MPRLILDINLPAERLLSLYRGQANRVLLKSRTGQQVNLSAHHLRSFVTTTGVQGCFALEYTDEGQFVSLKRHPQ